MGEFRGFGALCYIVKKFLEEHGYYVHWGAWLDVHVKTSFGKRLVLDLQIGHWKMFRAPRRGAKSCLWVTTEGRVSREARKWLLEYDYLFAQSKFVQRMLEEIDVPCEVIYAGIDVEHFRPLHMKKWIDVLSVGIWESSWDDRKFMNRVHEVAFPYTCYIHTKSTLDYSELPLLYNQAKVYVSLSGCEGINIPVIEANACGLPVIYNNAPATNEYAFGIAVDPVRVYEVEDRGVPFLIHEPNIPEIRRRVHELLQNPKRLQELSIKAREHALKFDYRKTLRKFLEILPPP